jgi:hypothetical protein
VNRRSRRDRARSDSHGRLCHRLRVHESCPGHGRNGTRHILMRIGRCLNFAGWFSIRFGGPL